MSMDLGLAITELHASLADFVPHRAVSRNLKTPDELDESTHGELERGRFTLLSGGVTDTRNLPGNAVQGGSWTLSIVGQFKLAEQASGADIEDKEFELFTELVAWVQSLHASAHDCLEIRALSQSQQLEKPYGWIAVNIEVIL